jgi:signal transduction histidine kinase
MRRRDTALLRLMAIIVAIFVGTSAAMTALAYRAVALYAQGQIEALVGADLSGLEESWLQNGVDGVKAALSRRMAAPQPRRLYLLVREDGEKIAGDFDFWPNTMAQDQAWTHFARTDERYDGLSARFADGSRVLIAHRRAVHEAMLAGLRADLLGPALAGFLAAILVSFFILRGLFHRIDQVNATCRAVAGGALEARVALGERPDELRELGANVNAMLDRIDVLMRGLRQVSDMVAHEMRTPLAHLRTRLERAASDLETAPLNNNQRQQTLKALDLGIADANGVIALFTALLDIAAIEAAEGDPSGLSRLDMADILREAVSLYEAAAEERGVALDLAAEPAPIQGDAHLLMRIVANILDNALKFSSAGQSIRIRSGQVGGEAFFIIEDQGPGMSAAFRARAFERFSRAPDARWTPGHGLGLSLVRAIARRHGMTISLGDAAPGLRFELRWGAA